MIELIVTTDIDQEPWTDLADQLHPDARTYPLPSIARIGILRNGMKSERASVSIAIQLQNGEIVFAETSYRLWRMAVTALAASPAAAEETLDD